MLDLTGGGRPPLPRLRFRAGSAGARASEYPAETSRRLACDNSVIVDGARRRRIISAALRRALARRDEGRCRFPGCSCRIVDAHHVEHWANGGPSELTNLLSFCGYRIEMVAGEPRFYRPDGRPILGRLTPRLQAVASLF